LPPIVSYREPTLGSSKQNFSNNDFLAMKISGQYVKSHSTRQLASLFRSQACQRIYNEFFLWISKMAAITGPPE
jgi:hypothetical protein